MVSSRKILMAFYRIDMMILGWFQKLSDRIQEWTGTDCFGMARPILAVAILGGMAVVAVRAKTGHSSSAAFYGMIMTLGYLVMSWDINIAERACRENRTALNPMVEKLGSFRIMQVVVTVFLLPDFMKVVYGNYYVKGVYQPYDRFSDIGFLVWVIGVLSYSEILGLSVVKRGY